MKKRVVIFGCGYHGRAAFRRCLEKKNFKVINWVDNNTKIQGKFLFKKKIINLNNLKKLNFDEIIFCGKYLKSQISSYKKLNLKKKIYIWDSFKLKPNSIQLKKRDDKLYKILEKVIPELEKNKILYWADTSGLLTLIRKNNISLLSDFDLGVYQKDLKKLVIILKKIKNINLQIGLFVRKKKYIKVAITSKNKSIEFEPAALDFTFYNKKKNTIYKYGNERVKVPIKLINELSTIKYKDIKIKIPKNYIKYLIHFYGKNYNKRPRFYHNRLKYKKYSIEGIKVI